MTSEEGFCAPMRKSPGLGSKKSGPFLDRCMMFDASAGLVLFNPKQQIDPPIGDLPSGRNINVIAISIYSEVFGEHESKSQLARESVGQQEKCRPRDECRTRSHKRRQDE